MILLRITPEQVDRAKKLYSFGKLNGSITEGGSNIFGALGEVIVHDYFINAGFKIDFNSTYDFDMIINTHKIDVKSKKFTDKFKPTKKWTVSVSDFNTNQQCEYYFFVGISDIFETGYLYGYIKKEDFYKKATFNKKDEIDPNGNGVWRFRGDCYNLEISKLNEFKK